MKMVMKRMINSGGIRKIELMPNGHWLVTFSTGKKHISKAGTMDTALDSARKSNNFPKTYVITAAKRMNGRTVSKDFIVKADTPAAAKKSFMKSFNAPASAVKRVEPAGRNPTSGKVVGGPAFKNFRGGRQGFTR